ncbi:MAG: hypothetical protein QOI07_2845 [Verrucomicrobiota bacterium]|jgi:hypothetical protein
MTLLPPSLFLNRLVVVAGGAIVYDEAFRKGVNIIRGSNGSGKSTICDFIFYILGGEVKSWKPEAERCDYVMAEVLFNSNPVTMRRQVAGASGNSMHVFWGSYEAAKASAIEGWQIFSFRRSAQRESFSQAAFRALGLPEVKSDLDSNITMHQLLRLAYVDQLSPVDSLMRHEEFDPALIRTTVGEMLLGVYDDSLYTDELKYRSLQRDLEEVTREVDNLIKIFGDVEQEIDFGKIQAEIAETKQQYDKLSVALTRIEQADEPEVSGALPSLEELQKKLMEQRRLWTETKNRTQRQEFEVTDSREFISSLEKRLAALDESIATRQAVGEFPLTHCPQCLAPLVPLEDERRCILCHQPIEQDAGKSQALRMRQELAVQIKESTALLDEKERHLTELRRSLPGIQQVLQMSEARFQEAANRVRSKRDESIDAMFVKKGFLESRLETLQKQAKSLSVLQDARNRKARLTSETQELGISIHQKRQKQLARLAEAQERIQAYTLAFLKRDLPREPGFQVAQSVGLDFARNTFDVDGRNHFAASSTVYLKNSIHFSILFASLDVPFFRYPRFHLCDNIEDKGMEEGRSHNFQRLVVETAAKFEVEHQIIFTTSKIAPDLNNTELCIGPEYSLEHHTLDFSNAGA